MLEQEPDFRPFTTLMDFAVAAPNAPAAHEVAAIADQLAIDISRTAATAPGGERRRAALAGALAQNPHVLPPDEPTTHVAPANGRASGRDRRYRYVEIPWGAA